MQRELRQTPPLQRTPDANQISPARLPGSTEPQAPRLMIPEHEGVFPGPARGGQGQGLSIERAAIHDGTIDQRSVGDGDVGLADDVVHHLGVVEVTQLVGASFLLHPEAEDHGEVLGVEVVDIAGA